MSSEAMTELHRSDMHAKVHFWYSPYLNTGIECSVGRKTNAASI